jgi:hypothetical protein
MLTASKGRHGFTAQTRNAYRSKNALYMRHQVLVFHRGIRDSRLGHARPARSSTASGFIDHDGA